MLVEVNATITSNFNLDRYGQVRLSSSGRNLQPTQVLPPGPGAAALADEARDTVFLDDNAGLGAQNLAIPFPTGGLDANNTLRAGTIVTATAPLLPYEHGCGAAGHGPRPEACYSGMTRYWKLPIMSLQVDGSAGHVLRPPVSFIDANPRPEPPALPRSSFTVASFNLLNFFTSFGERGASNQDEYDRQLAKLVSAIKAVDADILGLVELENNGFRVNATSSQRSAIATLVDAVNGPSCRADTDTDTDTDAPGVDCYALISPFNVTKIGTDAISVGIIYKPAAVTPIGNATIIDETVDPEFNSVKNRPSLAQTFAFVGGGTGNDVTIVVNHLKSKGSSCEDVGDSDMSDGQGNCAQTRHKAANAVGAWGARQAGSDVVIVGDLNSYAKEDAIRNLTTGWGFVNLQEAFEGPEAYSYEYDGFIGTLDYALASSSLAVRARGLRTWHINADEPDAKDYNLDYGRDPTYYKADVFRSSDHDIVIAAFDWPCPDLPTCNDAHSMCLDKIGADSYMNFTCHAGSDQAVYECSTGPSTMCTGRVALDPCELPPVVLGAAGPFSVLAGAAVTNSGLSRITGDLGVSPGTSVTGFGPGKMLDGSSIHSADPASNAGSFDLTTAYNFAAGLSLCPISRIGELGGLTLPPGLYKSTGGMAVTSSDLYLDAGHDSEAVWIFQMASTFTSAVSKTIILLNGARASNIFWQVGSSGTIGAYSTFEGTMMAYASVTLGTGAVVNGRVLARVAAVTMLANIITNPGPPKVSEFEVKGCAERLPIGGDCSGWNASCCKEGLSCFPEDSVLDRTKFSVSRCRAEKPDLSSGTAASDLCDAPGLPIGEIQGRGSSSPWKDTKVNTSGIVTGVINGGFFIQDANGTEDGDPETSDAIFVYVPIISPLAMSITLGDNVDVSGEVKEIGGLTMLIDPEIVHLSGNASGCLVVPVQLMHFPKRSEVESTNITMERGGLTIEVAVETLEALESMLVEVNATITSNFNLDRYGQVRLSSSGRNLQPTQVLPPGPGAAALADEARDTVFLDDNAGLGAQNLAIPFPTGGLDANNTLRAGTIVTATAPLLPYEHGCGAAGHGPRPEACYSGMTRYWKLPIMSLQVDGSAGHVLRPPVSFIDANPRPEPPALPRSSFTVASFNLLNFFTSFGERGASNQDEYDRQLAKLVSAIKAVDADILGLVELENNGFRVNATSSQRSAIATLVDAVNGPSCRADTDTDTDTDAPGVDCYALISPFNVTKIGTDAISVGIIYKPAAVTPIGNATIIDETVDPEFNSVKNRPSLAQTFAFVGGGTGNDVTIVVNHLKSKGSSCEDVGDSDMSDGQGNCAQTRHKAANAVGAWGARQAGSDVVIVGDLNSYAKEDAIRNLTTGWGFVNLQEAFEGPEAYSYEYDGFIGTLDYALASSSLAVRARGLRTWHINADEPDAKDYNLDYGRDPTYYKADVFRSSDHDIVIAAFDWPCPDLPTCNDAHSMCLDKIGADSYMNFTCHAGSDQAVYECSTGPSTMCTGRVALDPCELPPVVLGAAGPFSVLAGAAVTNSGLSRITGDLGVSPGTSVTGFGPGKMLDGSSIHSADPASNAGSFDLTTAYNFAAGLSLCPISRIGELGGLTLPPGLYKSTGGMAVTSSDLYLDAGHDSEAVWIFQMASTFTSAVSKKIILLNGARASNIFWQVGSSGTIGAYSTFEGTMMAYASVTLGTGAVVNGRVLARVAAVTMLANIITNPGPPKVSEFEVKGCAERLPIGGDCSGWNASCCKKELSCFPENSVLDSTKFSVSRCRATYVSVPPSSMDMASDITTRHSQEASVSESRSGSLVAICVSIGVAALLVAVGGLVLVLRRIRSEAGAVQEAVQLHKDHGKANAQTMEEVIGDVRYTISAETVPEAAPHV